MKQNKNILNDVRRKSPITSKPCDFDDVYYGELRFVYLFIYFISLAMNKIVEKQMHKKYKKYKANTEIKTWKGYHNNIKPIAVDLVQEIIKVACERRLR